MTVSPTPGQAARLDRLLEGLRRVAVAIDPEGLNNDVAIVTTESGVRVARLPKSDAARRALPAEAELLNWLAPKLPTAIPRPDRVTEDGMTYPLLPGNPLSPADLQSMPPAARSSFARDVGRFLSALQGVVEGAAGWPAALRSTGAPKRARAVWSTLWAEVAEHVHPLLQRHQRQFAQRLATEAGRLDFAPTVIHGDLAPYHLLAHEGELVGVIDWGECRRDDPARDVGSLLHAYGEAFVAKMAEAYPLDPASLRRARYYAHAVEFMWTLHGLKSGDVQWFAAHLGGPRDVRLPWIE